MGTSIRIIDYHLKERIEQQNPKITLSGSTKRNFLFQIFEAGLMAKIGECTYKCSTMDTFKDCSLLVEMMHLHSIYKKHIEWNCPWLESSEDILVTPFSLIILQQNMESSKENHCYETRLFRRFCFWISIPNHFAFSTRSQVNLIDGMDTVSIIRLPEILNVRQYSAPTSSGIKLPCKWCTITPCFPSFPFVSLTS